MNGKCKTRGELQQILEDAEGMSLWEIAEEAVMDGVSPGVCRFCGSLSGSVEPDCGKGYCEYCKMQGVVSAPRVLGVI